MAKGKIPDSEYPVGFAAEHEALKAIALHFEGCDLDGDDSAKWVVRTAAAALGWYVGRDEYGQITYPDRHRKP